MLIFRFMLLFGGPSRENVHTYILKKNSHYFCHMVNYFSICFKCLELYFS